MFVMRSDIPPYRCGDLQKSVDSHISFDVIIVGLIFNSTDDHWHYDIGFLE